MLGHENGVVKKIGGFEKSRVRDAIWKPLQSGRSKET